MEMEISRFQVVLVEPETSGNIGAVCRAMKTMGFSKTYSAVRVCRKVKQLD
jgi:tRNA C32,U32 (ribose-2'-O)-methylase TrmJ